MPNVPGWFQAPDYFFNKLAQMRVSNADYTADQLAAAFNEAGYTIAGATEADIAGAAEQLFRHFNDWGNDENVSPNNYFNVATYKANKLAQVIADGQEVPAGFTSWTPEALDAAMAEAGLSYWDHYTQYGTEEGINPSNAFNTDEYLQKKADQLNSLPEDQMQPLPNGELGEWTPALVAEAFKEADLNAVEHYMLYNASENIGYMPGPEAPANTVELKPGAEVVDDGGISTAFVGVVTNNPGTNTLDREDQITGTNNGDQLDATLNAQWIGFMNKGGMKGVPVVNITAKGDYDFNAKGIGGATTYNVNGNSDLAELGADVTAVNLNNVDQGNYSIGFANRVMNGKTDALTLGVNNVVTYDDDMKAQDVKVQVYGVENLTVNATGDTTSRIQLVDSNLEALNITGNGDLRVASTSTRIAAVDGSTATGDIRVNTGSSKVADVNLGSGDDTLVTTGIAKNASIDGGEGHDTIQFNAGASGTYALATEALETVKFHDTGNITVNGQNMNGLEGFALDRQHNSVTLNNVGTDLDLAVSDVNTAHVTAQTVENLNVTVGDGEATDLETNPQNDVFNGSITGKNLTSMSINMAEEDSQFVLDGTGNLQNLSQVNISGVGNVEPDAGYAKGMVDLSAAASLGSKAANLSVQAGSYEGNFKAAFSSNAKTDTLYVTGSEGNNNIKISGSGYDYLEVVGDGNTNVIDLRGYNGNTKDAFVNLSGDANVILVDDPSKWGDTFKDIQGQVLTSTSDIRQDFLAQGMIVDIEGTSGTPISVNLENMATTDFSGVKYEDGTKVSFTGLQDGQDLILGQTTGAAGSIGANSYQPNTTLNAVGNTDVDVTFTQAAEIGINTSGTSSDGTTAATATPTTLNLTNTSGQDVVVAPATAADGLATAGNEAGFNYALDNVGTLNINSGAGGTFTLQGGNIASGSYTMLTTRMRAVSDMTLAGEDDITLAANIGRYNHDLTVDATEAGNVYVPGILAADHLYYDGSAKTDQIAAQIYGSISSPSTIDLGAGADLLALNLNGVGDNTIPGGATATNIFSQINVALGDADDAADVVSLFGKGGDDAHGALVSISEFGTGDKIVWTYNGQTKAGLDTFYQSASDGSDNLSTDNLSGTQWEAILDFLKVPTPTDIDLATNQNYINYNGNTYVALNNGTASWATQQSGGFTDLQGLTLLEVQGVSITPTVDGIGVPA